MSSVDSRPALPPFLPPFGLGVTVAPRIPPANSEPGVRVYVSSMCPAGDDLPGFFWGRKGKSRLTGNNFCLRPITTTDACRFIKARCRGDALWPYSASRVTGRRVQYRKKKYFSYDRRLFRMCPPRDRRLHVRRACASSTPSSTSDAIEFVVNDEPFQRRACGNS